MRRGVDFCWVVLRAVVRHAVLCLALTVHICLPNDLVPDVSAADVAVARPADSTVAAEYAIVVSSATQADEDWNAVVATLRAKHGAAAVIVWRDDVRESLEGLRAQHPRYTCFVARPAEAGRDFVAAVHQLSRQLDSDPYADTQWGILTGYDAANAQRIAADDQPLTVRDVAAGTEVALEMCQQGIWYDELVKNKMVSKSPGAKSEQQSGPADTTRALAETLTDRPADLFVTSGHATERDWQIGFRYRNGQFRSRAGQMFGHPTQGDPFAIQSDHPRVYLAVGNCLMGHIDGSDAMTLAWLNSLGVRQMVGYTVVTWYGYGGWGLLDYFVEQPGRYSLTEAFFANQHALVHRLETCFEQPAAGDTSGTTSNGQSNLPVPNARGRALGLSRQDARGLLYDRDVVAFYGDPAYQARLAPGPLAYDQTLEVTGQTYTLTITPRRGAASFEPVNTNGSQRGWRPIVHFFDQRIGDFHIVQGADLQPVITDDFILVPNPRTCDPQRDYRVVFTAAPRAATE